MTWKTRILALIFLLLFASQGLADPLDHWRVRNDNYINAVKYANALFVAVTGGDNGTILTSPDGINWTQRWYGTDEALWGVIYANDKNHTFVAVGEAG